MKRPSRKPFAPEVRERAVREQQAALTTQTVAGALKTTSLL
jgi:hypothetical protein